MRTLNRYNQTLRNRDVIFRLRRKYFVTSWIEIDVPQSPVLDPASLPSSRPNVVPQRRKFDQSNTTFSSTSVAPQIPQMSSIDDQEPMESKRIDQDPQNHDINIELQPRSIPTPLVDDAPVETARALNHALASAQSMEAYSGLTDGFADSSQITKIEPPSYEDACGSNQAR